MLRLVSCGHNYVHEEGITIRRPGGAKNYAFVLFRCDALVLLGGELRPVPRNSCVLFRPDTPQLYRQERPPFVNDWFHCDGEDAPLFFRELGLPLDTPMRAAEPQALSRRILELGTVHRQEGPLRERILDCDLRSFFYRLRAVELRTGLEHKSGRYLRQFSELRAAIYSSPQTRPSVDELAARVSLSRSYFQHIYKDLFGVPVLTDMINSRLEYARYLLESGSLSVADVAAQCGYENEVHFIRQFKQAVGITPGRYVASAKQR